MLSNKVKDYIEGIIRGFKTLNHADEVETGASVYGEFAGAVGLDLSEDESDELILSIAEHLARMLKNKTQEQETLGEIWSLLVKKYRSQG